MFFFGKDYGTLSYLLYLTVSWIIMSKSFNQKDKKHYVSRGHTDFLVMIIVLLLFIKVPNLLSFKSIGQSWHALIKNEIKNES